MLSGNKLSEWPATVLASLPVLQELSLAQNPIAEFPRGAFAAVPKLQVLDLSGVAVTLPPPPALSEMPHLQELRLRRMWLKEFPDDLKSLLKLRTLDLSQNSITVIPEVICSKCEDVSNFMFSLQGGGDCSWISCLCNQDEICSWIPRFIA
jgi:Leucine-rich repeat (LRR) protein